MSTVAIEDVEQPDGTTKAVYTCHWADIGYTCVFELDGDYLFKFKTYVIVANAKHGERMYTRNGAVSNMDLSENGLEDAEVYLYGTIKWDGCSNMAFMDQDNDVFLHFCGRSAIDDLHTLMSRLYDLAAQYVPQWHKELAK